jgi:hypothetical protein
VRGKSDNLEMIEADSIVEDFNSTAISSNIISSSKIIKATHHSNINRRLHTIHQISNNIRVEITTTSSKIIISNRTIIKDRIGEGGCKAAGISAEIILPTETTGETTIIEAVVAEDGETVAIEF